MMTVAPERMEPLVSILMDLARQMVFDTRPEHAESARALRLAELVLELDEMLKGGDLVPLRWRRRATMFVITSYVCNCRTADWLDCSRAKYGERAALILACGCACHADGPKKTV